MDTYLRVGRAWKSAEVGEVPGQEFADAGDGVVCDTLQDVTEIDPALSSVSQSGYQLGSTAASILLERIQGYTGPAKHIVLETSLKLRDSIAPPVSAIAARRATARNHRAARS